MDDSAPGPGALDGVRIVDLTTVLMGPLAARMLADHGADVIRVEAPGVEPRITGGSRDGVGGISYNSHRNKRSIVLDLKSAAGAEAMADLVGTADVFVSNMRAAALDRLGLSAATLRARHPALVHCVANGYGSNGPYGDRAAYDDAIQAQSGLAALRQRVGGEPEYVPSVVADKISALHVVQAVLAALLHRRATGEGQTIEVPMFETMVSFNLVEHLRGAALVPPKGEIGYRRLLTPNRRPYRCADGWVALLPYTTANWRDFFAIIDRPDLAADPRFATHQSRIEHIDELYGHVADAAPRHTVAEWVDLCGRHSIPAAPVTDIADLLDDPHLRAVEFFPEVEHPVDGRYRTIRDPVRYDRLFTGLRRHAPIPGQHTAEVLAELGWDRTRIATVVETEPGL